MGRSSVEIKITVVQSTREIQDIYFMTDGIIQVDPVINSREFHKPYRGMSDWLAKTKSDSVLHTMDNVSNVWLNA